MANQSLSTPCVSIVNNHAITTSKAVAEFFGKRHADVLRAIENLDCSPEFTSTHFCVHAEFIQAGAVERESKYYEMTKDGFTFLVMGFTGKRAAQFKEAYINRFNELETALHNPLALTNGQHYVVAKDGVVIYHKVLSDRTAQKYLPQKQPTAPCLADLQRLPTLANKADYTQIRAALRQLVQIVSHHQPYDQVRPAVLVLETVERLLMRLWTMIDEASFRAAMVENSAKQGQPLKGYELDTIRHIKQILNQSTMTLDIPSYY